MLFEMLRDDVKCKRCRFFSDGNCSVLKQPVKKNEFCSLTKQQIEKVNKVLRDMFGD